MVARQGAIVELGETRLVRTLQEQKVRSTAMMIRAYMGAQVPYVAQEM